MREICFMAGAMTCDEIMRELAAKGSEATKRVLLKHGAKEPFFGVKIADLKPIAKRLKGRQELAMELYATGNGDAQYLAGMVADGRKMSAAQLQGWAETAAWDMISGTIVPWVASEHVDGFALATKWIDAKDEQRARAGWATLGALAATKADRELPIAKFGMLLERVRKGMSKASDGVRYAMNNFVIVCGTYVEPLADQAIETARAIGKVEVDMGETACKVPDAESHILKSRRGAPVAPKRKTMRC